MSTFASRVATFGTTIFTEINLLAQQYNALNLGQGKPDFDTPPELRPSLATGDASRARARRQPLTTRGSLE